MRLLLSALVFLAAVDLLPGADPLGADSASALVAGPSTNSAGAVPPASSDPKKGDGSSVEYHLFPRDMLRFTVLGEADLSVERRVDALGRITLPLLGTVDLKGLTTTAAEEKVRQLYIAQEILVRPQIAITVIEYSVKEISILGQVRTPGKVSLPIETDSLTVVDAISKAGGFTRISKSDAVQITRQSTTGGPDQSITVDVQRMIDGRGGVTFQVLPGDVIFVPERVF